MDIHLRLIDKDSAVDKDNYIALQKSVALFPNNYKKEYEEIFWKEQFENPNRICYVIEKLPEKSYCGECAIKDISLDIPEVEIELMQEYRNQGVGYESIIRMLSIVKEEYGKCDFYAKIEPDNYASQFLFEKLGGIPAGLTKDPEISDERKEEFINKHRYLLDERMYSLARVFGVEKDMLLTHLLVYRLNIKEMELCSSLEEKRNHREYIECSRTLSKEKNKDVMYEWIDELKEISNMGQDKDKMSTKIAEMEKKLLEKMEQMKTINLKEVKISNFGTEK